MSKVIQFPTVEEREWLKVEAIFKDRLQEVQTPEPVINKVLSWLKDVWVKQRELPIHFQIEADLVCHDAIDSAVHETVRQMREKLYLLLTDAAELKVELEMLKYRHNL